ncbi:hypothetical protein K239x_56940 [Planctomycetes bacterium K23_9]|uniref:Uncharacterized protein n=1 Tax=Stieleria marina TaxID=1930275 RepID=A0A517P2S2_9BACT|nr:hypothetical protein K239x_56940 [Planctomycetes bacterium K23_9]
MNYKSLALVCALISMLVLPVKGDNCIEKRKVSNAIRSSCLQLVLRKIRPMTTNVKTIFRYGEKIC